MRDQLQKWKKLNIRYDLDTDSDVAYKFIELQIKTKKVINK